jgi:phosphoribosylglycinamide formyltransferase
MAAPPCNILVMASGKGTNFQALIDAVGPGKRIPDARIVQLVVNRKDARDKPDFAVARAKAAGIPWTYFNLLANGFQRSNETDAGKLKEGRRRYDEALARLVTELEPRPDLIVLAGWMHVFTSAFLDPVKREGCYVINLHPALPGEFGVKRGSCPSYPKYEADECRRGIRWR